MELADYIRFLAQMRMANRERMYLAITLGHQVKKAELTGHPTAVCYPYA
jgi:hypothetical protein